MKNTSVKFQPIQYIRDGWDFFKTHWKFLVKIQLMPLVFFLLLILAGGIGALLTGLLYRVSSIASIVVGVIFAIAFLLAFIELSFIIPLGMMVAIRDVEKKPRVMDVYKTAWKSLSRYIGTILLSVLIVTGGLILFIIPGLIWATRLSVVGWTTVEEGTGAGDTVKRSFALTKGNFWSLALTLVILSGVFAIIRNIIPSVLNALSQNTSMPFPIPVGLTILSVIYSVVVAFAINPINVYASRRIYQEMK